MCLLSIILMIMNKCAYCGDYSSRRIAHVSCSDTHVVLDTPEDSEREISYVPSGPRGSSRSNSECFSEVCVEKGEYFRFEVYDEPSTPSVQVEEVFLFDEEYPGATSISSDTSEIEGRKAPPNSESELSDQEYRKFASTEEICGRYPNRNKIQLLMKKRRHLVKDASSEEYEKVLIPTNTYIRIRHARSI